MNPATNPMFHRHLVLAYSFVWFLQLAYLAYVLLQWYVARRASRQ